MLLRTRAADHPALRRTCHLFRDTLDSADFCEQRAATEWAAVEAVPWWTEEGEDTAVSESTICLFVDGNDAGRFSFTLVSRRITNSFTKIVMIYLRI